MPVLDVITEFKKTKQKQNNGKRRKELKRGKEPSECGLAAAAAVRLLDHRHTNVTPDFSTFLPV